MRTLRTIARITTGAVIATAMLSVTGAGTASACSCADSTIDDIADDIAVAFVGTQVERMVENESTLNGATLTFEVDRVYLGDVTTPFTVHTAAEDASCGVDLGGAGPVAVVARDQGGELNVGLCDTTTVDELAAAYGPGEAPPLADPVNDSWRSNTLARAVLLGLLGVVIVAAGFVIASRRRD